MKIYVEWYVPHHSIIDYWWTCANAFLTVNWMDKSIFCGKMHFFVYIHIYLHRWVYFKHFSGIPQSADIGVSNAIEGSDFIKMNESFGFTDIKVCSELSKVWKEVMPFFQDLNWREDLNFLCHISIMSSLFSWLSKLRKLSIC